MSRRCPDDVLNVEALLNRRHILKHHRKALRPISMDVFASDETRARLIEGMEERGIRNDAVGAADRERLANAVSERGIEELEQGELDELLSDVEAVRKVDEALRAADAVRTPPIPPVPEHLLDDVLARIKKEAAILSELDALEEDLRNRLASA